MEPLCKKMQDLFSPYFDGELETESQEQFDAHLSTCPECAAAWEDYRNELMPLSRMPEIQPSRRFTETVLGRIDREDLRSKPKTTKRSAILVSAISSIAAALLVAVMFFALPQKPVEAVTPEYFSSQLNANLDQANAFFRQIANLNDEQPEEGMDLVRYELQVSALPEFTNDLERKFQIVAHKLPAEQQHEIRRYLTTVQTALGQIRRVVQSRGTDERAVREIKQVAGRSGVLDSAMIVSYSIQSSDNRSGLRIRISVNGDTPDALAFFKAGKALYYRGRYAEATKYFNQVMVTDPNTSFRNDTIFWLGTCAEKLGDRDTARKYFEHLVSTKWLDKKPSW